MAQQPPLTPPDSTPWSDAELRDAWRTLAHGHLLNAGSSSVKNPKSRRRWRNLLSAVKKLLGPLDGMPTGQPLAKQALFNLYAGLVFALVLAGFYAFLLVEFNVTWIRVGLTVMILFNAVLVGLTLPLIGKFNRLTQAQAVLPFLKLLRDDLKEWWRLQRWMAGGVLPLAAATGFLMGGVVGSGDENFVAFEDKWNLVVVLVGVSLAAVPLGLRFSDWLYKWSYARDLRRVEAWIEELESWGPEEQGGGGTSSRETP